MKIIHMSELIDAIIGEDEETALKLIPSSDINSVKYDSTVVLPWACIKLIQMTELVDAIIGGNEETALKLIPSSDINSVKYGSPVLSWACMKKMTNVAMAILATGQSKPEHNKRALLYAKLYKMTEVINALENYDNYMTSLQQPEQTNPYDDPNYVMTIDI